MTESQLFLEWTAAARREGEVSERRLCLLELLDFRFPGEVTPELRAAITKEDNLERLDEWFTASIKAFPIATFSPLVLHGDGGSLSESPDCAEPLFVDAARAKRQAERDVP